MPDKIEKLLEETERLCAAATPGSYYVQPSCSLMDHPMFCVMILESLGSRVVAEEVREVDARLIAHAHTALPELVAEVRRLQAELADIMED